MKHVKRHFEVSLCFPFVTLSQYLLQSLFPFVMDNSLVCESGEDLDYGSGYTDHREKLESGCCVGVEITQGELRGEGMVAEAA